MGEPSSGAAASAGVATNMRGVARVRSSASGDRTPPPVPDLRAAADVAERPPATLRPCGQWRCLLEPPQLAGDAAGLECELCMGEQHADALLPCPNCRHRYCALCLLRLIEGSIRLFGREFWATIPDYRPACAFCRVPFPLTQIEELTHDFHYHRDQLPVALDIPLQAHPNPPPRVIPSFLPLPSTRPFRPRPAATLAITNPRPNP